MAITKTILASGPRNFVVHIYFEQDGVDQGEFSNAVLVDPVADFGLAKGPMMRLYKAWHSFAWFDLTLKWGGLVPRPVWTFARDTDAAVDFQLIGGLADVGKPPPSDDNGKILGSSSGFSTLGSQGTLVLVLRQ